MSRNKTILTVVFTVLVMVALSAGGYALYRYGYARGRSSVAVDSIEGRFHHEFDRHPLPEFRDRFAHAFPMGAMPRFGFSQPFWGIWFFRILPGLFLMLGLVTLAVIGGIHLLRGDQTPHLPSAPGHRNHSSEKDAGTSESQAEAS